MVQKVLRLFITRKWQNDIHKTFIMAFPAHISFLLVITLSVCVTSVVAVNTLFILNAAKLAKRASLAFVAI